jgi:hypothetical protein
VIALTLLDKHDVQPKLSHVVVQVDQLQVVLVIHMVPVVMAYSGRVQVKNVISVLVIAMIRE